MKITQLELKEKQNVVGIGIGQKYIKVGQNTSSAFGNGKVAEIIVDKSLQAFIISKVDNNGQPARFKPSTGANVGPLNSSFDVIMVPIGNVASCGLNRDEQPAQQQAQGSKR